MSYSLTGQEKKNLMSALVIMTAAALSVSLPLMLLKSVVAAFTLYHLGFCLLLPAIHLVIVKKLDFKALLEFLGFKGGDFGKSVFWGSIHGLVFAGLIIGVYLIARNASLFDNVNAILSQWGVVRENKWAVVVFMILFNGAVEEIFWRGYALKRLQISVKPWSAITISTLFYTSYHSVTIINFFHFGLVSAGTITTIFLAGLIWGWLRVYFNSLWAPVIGHSLATLGYMLIYVWL